MSKAQQKRNQSPCCAFVMPCCPFISWTAFCIYTLFHSSWIVACFSSCRRLSVYLFIQSIRKEGISFSGIFPKIVNNISSFLLCRRGISSFGFLRGVISILMWISSFDVWCVGLCRYNYILAEDRQMYKGIFEYFECWFIKSGSRYKYFIM